MVARAASGPLRGLLAEDVAVCEVFGDPEDAVLLPAETPYVERAAARRRAEFRSGRWCARTALADLGVATVAIPVGERGAPSWPAGVTGSITHCDGYRAAAVSRGGPLRSIGIDAEPEGPLPQDLLALLAGPVERDRLRALAARCGGTPWDRLLFSAKESVYKAWFPLTRRWLDFTDVEVDISQEGGTFTARLMAPAPAGVADDLTRLSGQWLHRQGLVVTSVTIPAGR